MTPVHMAFRAATLDLLWSLWTELGVPGPFRRHTHWLADPEALLVATPRLGASDPRLLGLALAWERALGGLLNPARRAALTPADAPGLLADAADARDVPLPLDRPALWRLRVRALLGINARAEVLAELALDPLSWRRASSFARTGATKRAVARVLADLHAAGFVHARPEGNAIAFRLQQADAFATLTRMPPHPLFQRVDEVLMSLVALDAVLAEGARGPASARAAWAASAEPVRFAVAAGLPVPPETPDALVAAVRTLAETG